MVPLTSIISYMSLTHQDVTVNIHSVWASERQTQSRTGRKETVERKKKKNNNNNLCGFYEYF